jgi:hypothetical protein
MNEPDPIVKTLANPLAQRGPFSRTHDLSGNVVNETSGKMRDHPRTPGVDFCDFMLQ